MPWFNPSLFGINYSEVGPRWFSDTFGRLLSDCEWIGYNIGLLLQAEDGK